MGQQGEREEPHAAGASVGEAPAADDGSEARARQQAFLAAIVEQIPQMVFVKDAADLRFVLLNAAGEALLGVARDDLIGRSDGDLFPPEQARFFTAKDRAVLDSGQMYDIAVEPIDTRNGRRLLHTRKVPIVDPRSGEPIYLLGISEDITAQHRHAEQTEQALRDAREADRARAEFVAVLSHELRTPLTGMVGMANLLAGTPLSAAQLEMVQVLQRSSARLHKLISDLLDLSSLDTGHAALDLAPFSPVEAASDALALFRQRAWDKGIALNLAPATGLPERVVGDASRIQQVLMNLVSNAVRHTRVGHVTVEIEVVAEMLRIAVVDTGDGIDPAHAARLFEPFRRGDNAVGEGAGLGLAISRRLVSLMEGRIAVEARPRGGSRFSFEIPVGLEISTEEPARVLVVDDDALSRRMAEVMLRGLGYEPTLVDSAEAALAHLESHGIDLVLMDRNLPGMDGLEATRRIRSLASPLCDACVVGISADTSVAERDECMAAGMDAWLPKPFTVRELESLLTEWSRDRHRTVDLPE